MPSLIALLHGPDQRGLVARTASWIYERGGNILHADQHRDSEAGIFFQRIEWIPKGNLHSEREAFLSLTDEIGMNARVQEAGRPTRTAILVSKADHCLHDLLLRDKAGELSAEITFVASNHMLLAEATATYGIPFFHIPVKKDAKAEAEEALLQHLATEQVALLILARYMQILSADFLNRCPCPVINIHHSFLPAFAGARPYHQAHERGVKLIGATAHYVTAELDAGPIIQQDVAHVNHRHSVPDLIRKGRDLEKSVLAQAVRWHLESRVLSYHNKTVVFD